ncbi:MAG: twin-arginine translocation signal domain-containing protein, partial [Halothiobacillus sp.]
MSFKPPKDDARLPIESSSLSGLTDGQVRQAASRREFLKYSLALAGGAALYGAVPTGLQTAAWAAGSDAPETTRAKLG